MQDKFTSTRRNAVEALFETMAVNKGWDVCKRGWPDFICFHPQKKRLIAVECKPWVEKFKRFQRLKSEQADICDWLERNGIECYISDGVRTQRYRREKHFPPYGYKP